MNPSEIRQYDKIVATFNPQHADKLKAEIAEYVGRECVWQAVQIYQREPYAGQWMMEPARDAGMPFPYALLGDLSDIREYEEPANLERKVIECPKDGHFLFEATEQFDGYIKVRVRPLDVGMILQAISEAMVNASTGGTWGCELRVNGTLYAMGDTQSGQ